MPIYIIFSILILHWISDFILQTHDEATNKSSNMEYLLRHTFKYSILMTLSIVFIMTLSYSLIFNIPDYDLLKYDLEFTVAILLLITFFTHTITDYFTSRWVKYYFDKYNYHNGFVIIGLDQILHYVQLFLTILLLFKF